MDNIDKYFVENNPNKRSTTYGKLIGLLEANREFNDTFTYNMITHNVEYKNKPVWDNDAYAGKEINDTDAIIIKGYLTRRYLVSPNKNTVIDAIIDISMRNKFHPIKDYLNSLEFDGVSRLKRFFPEICMTADNAYTQSIGVKMFTALVARIFEPGIKYDQLVVIEGAQGILKSTLIRSIVGKKYFASIGFHQSDKDIIDVMRGKWALEIEEMADFKKADVERIKSLLSRDTDRIRLSYGRLAEDLPRSSIFIGTLNPKGTNKYLHDETANRRFWPVRCEHNIRLEEFEAIRDKLFAEAVYLYKNNERLYLDNPEILKIAKKEQEIRQDVDAWEDVVADHLKNNFDERLYTYDILERVLHVPRHSINKFMAARVGIILTNLGWKHAREASGLRRYYFQRPEEQKLEVSEETIEWKN